MRRREYEAVQRGNGHRLTDRQHVFPVASIARFAGPDGCVSLVDLKRRKSWRPKPDDLVFCARRVWDQQAEAGYMRGIEDAFQALAERVIADPGQELSALDDAAASRFYALWWCRAACRYAPDGEIPINGVVGQVRSQDQEERLESRWTGFIRPGGLPARQLYGLQIQKYIDFIEEDLQERRWGVLALAEGELIVPDYPEQFFVPLTPTLCLA